MSRFFNFVKSIISTGKSVIIDEDNAGIDEFTTDSQINQLGEYENISDKDREILKKSLIDIDKIVNESENSLKRELNIENFEKNNFGKNVKVKTMKQVTEVAKKVEETQKEIEHEEK